MTQSKGLCPDHQVWSLYPQKVRGYGREYRHEEASAWYASLI